MSIAKNTGLRIISNDLDKNIFATVVKHQNTGELLVNLSAIIKGSNFSSEFMILEPLDASEKFTALEKYAALPFKGILIDDNGNKDFILTGIVTID